MNTEDLTNQVIEAVKGLVARSLAARDVRLAAVEMRTGALSMALGRSVGGPEKIAELERLLQRVKHLEELEARVKALEDAR